MAGTRNRATKDDEDPFKGVKHPFEESGLLDGKPLTAFQRAITYSIVSHDGRCNETDMLDFIKEHWNYINEKKKGGYSHSSLVTVLHINLKSRKLERRLFTEDGHKGWWRCSHPPGYEETQQEKSEESSGETTQAELPSLFEDIVYSFIYNSSDRKMGTAELTESIKEKVREDCNGLYKGQPIDRRVRLTLLHLNTIGKLLYDSTNDMWYTSRSRNKIGMMGMPNCLMKKNVREFHIFELWNYLKTNKIY